MGESEKAGKGKEGERGVRATERGGGTLESDGRGRFTGYKLGVHGQAGRRPPACKSVRGESGEGGGKLPISWLNVLWELI